MIMPEYSRPENSLYFLGAELIKLVSKNNIKECNVFSLYEIIKKSEINYSINQYLMTLNWLYLLGYLSLTEKGNIQLCS